MNPALRLVCRPHGLGCLGVSLIPVQVAAERQDLVGLPDEVVSISVNTLYLTGVASVN